jgi:glutathione S-transferase
MTAQTFKPKAYIREGCPFSFKFWLFLVEAGLSPQFEVIRCNPDDPGFEALKARLSAGLGKPASFPTVETGPGRYLSDSDALIAHYAREQGVDVSKLAALTFYKETIFPQLEALHTHKGHG